MQVIWTSVLYSKKGLFDVLDPLCFFILICLLYVQIKLLIFTLTIMMHGIIYSLLKFYLDFNFNHYVLSEVVRELMRPHTHTHKSKK